MSVRKYLKIQPVENKLIDHYIWILKILFDGNKSGNQIFQILKNSKPKKYHIKAISLEH